MELENRIVPTPALIVRDCVYGAVPSTLSLKVTLEPAPEPSVLKVTEEASTTGELNEIAPLEVVILPPTCTSPPVNENAPNGLTPPTCPLRKMVPKPAFRSKFLAVEV